MKRFTPFLADLFIFHVGYWLARDAGLTIEESIGCATEDIQVYEAEKNSGGW